MYGMIDTVGLDLVFFFVLFGGGLALKRQPLVIKRKPIPQLYYY